MANLDNQFKNLPAEVKAYLISLKAVELNSFILEKNKIASSDFAKVTSIITRLFNKTIKVLDLPAVLKSELGLGDLASKNLAGDIVGVRLLIIKDWLGEDLEAVIKNWGGNPAEYFHFIEEQKKALVEEEKYFNEELKTEPEFVFKPKASVVPVAAPALDIAQEKTDSLALFKNNLADLLKSADADEFISDYNLILISLISDDESFKQNLENVFYTNSEELTSERLKSEDKEVSPTIANWLKDFIRENGSEMFDDLALAHYLSSAVNAKNLNIKEKTLLRRLLGLYRNLSFFPASMGNNPLENWEIIPVKREEEFKKEKTLDGSVPKIIRNKTAAQSVAAPLLDKPSSTLTELEKMLPQYPATSLEHKAVSQEISRFKKAELKKTQKAK
jgi:hypothetical protein